MSDAVVSRQMHGFESSSEKIADLLEQLVQHYAHNFKFSQKIEIQKSPNMSFQEYPRDFDTLNEWHAQRLLLLMKNTDASRKYLEEYKADAEEMLRQYCPPDEPPRSSRSRKRRDERRKKRSKKSSGFKKFPRIKSNSSGYYKTPLVDVGVLKNHTSTFEEVSASAGCMTIVSRSSTQCLIDEVPEELDTDEPELMALNGKGTMLRRKSFQFQLPNDLFLTRELEGTSLSSPPPPSPTFDKFDRTDMEPCLYVWENP